MKHRPEPEEAKAAVQDTDFDAMACSAEFTQGCIEPEDDK